MYQMTAGIGVELTIAPTKLTRSFIKDFPPHLGQPVNPDAICVPLMFPDELANAGLAASERAELPEVANDMLASLGSLGIIGARLPIVENVLKPIKGFLAIELDDDDPDGYDYSILDEVRSTATSIVAEKTRIRLRSYLPKHYVYVAETRRHIARKVTYKKHFPKEFVVTGCRVGVDTVGYTRDGQPPDYVNFCPRSKR